MGLLIKLQDGDTALKSLKFGNDRPGGGDSGQPYIKNPIEGTSSPINKDFLLRGGINTPLDAAEDVARLTKYFFDFRNPSGLLFTAKQNLLSRVAVKAEVAEKITPNVPGPAYGGGAINEGIYTPLSTLAEAGVVAFGGHLNKQGLDPTGLSSPDSPSSPSFSIKKYGPTSFVLNEFQYNNFKRSSPPVKTFVRETKDFTSRFDLEPSAINLSFSNRLLRFWYTKELPQINFDPNLYSYSGGPGSILGFGKTNIKFATLGDGETPLRTGVNNILFQNPNTRSEFLKGRMPSLYDRWFINYVDGVPTYEETLNVAKFIGASQKYGLSKDEIWTGNVDEDPGYLYTINLDKYLTSANGYRPRSEEQRREDSKWTLPVGASLLYNSFNKNVTDERISNDNSILQQKIDDLKAQQDEINKKANDPAQYTFQETTYTDLGPAGTQINVVDKRKSEEEVNRILSSYSQQWLALNQQIKELEAQIRQPNNLDYINSPVKVVSLDNTDGLYKGKYSYESSIENNSVYEPGTLTERTDIYSYNTFTQKEIDNFSTERETPVYDFVDGITNNNVNRIYYDSTTDGTLNSKSLLVDYHDLIDFSFRIVDPKNPSGIAALLDFRAYIDSFSDTYSNNWSEQAYMGRAEKQYRYNSFDRNISLGFTIVADNSNHLQEMYYQLNILASSIAPTYTSQGYMAGMLHRLRVGNYIWDQWGILEGLTYEITDEAPWEISLPNQLPMYIKVTGLKFKPIHNFRPEFAQYVTKKGSIVPTTSQKFIKQTEGSPNI